MKLLITGGAGFIGSHIAERYLASGAEITILDNFSTGNRNNLKKISSTIKIVDGDIRDSRKVNKIIKWADCVIHMAAALGVANIMNDTQNSISTNVIGSEVVLNAAAKYGKRILIASTSEIYGKNPTQPLTEESDRIIGAPTNIRWSYSDAKAIEEALATSLFHTQNLRVTTVRFFNTVGPKQSGMYGMVLPRFIESALGNREIVVYGDGNQSRVFCHVNDAVNAVELLLENDQSVGEVYNVGGVGEISINDLAKLCIKMTGSESEIKHIPYEVAYPIGFEDMFRRVPDTKKIKALTGWESKIEIEEIIQDIVNSRLN